MENYILGSNDKYQSGENNSENRINLPKEISFKPTDFFIMASAGDCYSAFIIKDKKTGKKKFILQDGVKMVERE